MSRHVMSGLTVLDPGASSLASGCISYSGWSSIWGASKNEASSLMFTFGARETRMVHCFVEGTSAMSSKSEDAATQIYHMNIHV